MWILIIVGIEAEGGGERLEGFSRSSGIVEHLAEKAVRQREVRVTEKSRAGLGHRPVMLSSQKQRPPECPMSLGVVAISGDRHLGQFARFFQALAAAVVPAVRVIK